MNTKDKGNVHALVQTAEQIGGSVWVISLVDFDAREETRATLVSKRSHTISSCAGRVSISSP